MDDMNSKPMPPALRGSGGATRDSGGSSRRTSVDEKNPPKVRCPFCLKNQLPKKHDLLCADCNNDKLETIRNSCLQNETVNDTNRKDINDIFDISIRLRNGEDPEAPVSNTSMGSIKLFSLQLLRRQLINQTIKLHNIDRSRDSLQRKVIRLNENIVNIEQDTLSARSKMKTLERDILNKYQRNITKINAEIGDFQNERISQIEKQSIQHQQSNFKIFKEFAFSSRNKGYTSKLRDSSHTLLFSQPIIKVEEFFDFNNKLFQLNGYIENLIKLQCHIVQILDHDGVTLPYLDELKTYLPDTNFYNLVQKKEDFMMNGGKVEADEEIDLDDPAQPIDINDLNPENGDTDRVVKLGKTIKLPLSSKTINNQLRRASMARVEDGPVLSLLPPRDLSPKSTSPEGTSPTKTHRRNSRSPEKSSPVKRPPLKSNLSGKKMVIVPHRILTKPFTKLSSKEYLKFLLVIVKILVNFKVLFALTIDLIPKNHNAISSTLSHTINQFRNGINANEKDMSSYNLEKIIHKVISMDDFFEYKLNSLQLKAKNPPGQDLQESNWSNILQSKYSSSSNLGSDSIKDNYPVDEFLQNSKEMREVQQLKQNLNDKPDGLKALYKDLFRGSIVKKPSAAKPRSDLHIYGNFSESNSGTNSPPQTAYINESTITTEHNELKLVMGEVHHLMVHGSARARHNPSPKNPHLNSSTLNMIAQSKVQLDEWDVVSKMYQ